MITQRRRDHEEHHNRSPQLQILDALLRIEELLQPRSSTTTTEPVAEKPKGTRGKVERL